MNSIRWIRRIGLGIVLASGLWMVMAADKTFSNKSATFKQSQRTELAVNENTATPVDRISMPKGFEVELIYSVPAAERGSWVNLCIDDKGRIIASDQFGGLYQFEPPSPGAVLQPTDIKRIPVDIRAANGLLWAFDALYVSVNDYEQKIDSGLYRVTDSNSDGELDNVEKLRTMYSQDDHGVHALLLSPDRKAIYMITGNRTDPVDTQRSLVPLHWGEDHLLPRMPDGLGHNRDRLAPGGIIYRISPDGMEWEIVSSGFRNIFDAAFNSDGELFTYDADMEYDFNTPWYRPTRVCHVTSGSSWGWRNGDGKRPEFYPDNLPPVVNIGPGSPTGVTFGYGARFPAKYQEALYLLDWSWGKIYAVHLERSGSTYSGTKETFITGVPLPVTDVIIHPRDGAMYFTIGGRRVQSGVYRVTYTGVEKTKPVSQRSSTNRLTRLRMELEKYHGDVHPHAIGKAWPKLDHGDRFVRWAARIALMHQPVEEWANRALAEKNHRKRVESLLALAKVSGIDPFHRKSDDAPINTIMQARLLEALAGVGWDRLDHQGRLTFVRTYQIVLNRFGNPDKVAKDRIIAQLNPHFPSASFPENWLLSETLCYLQAPSAAAKTMALLMDAPTQEEQMEYARSLRFLKAGWTRQLRKAYFDWFLSAANYRGGASFAKFMEFIRQDAVASIPEAELASLRVVLDSKPAIKSPFETMAAAMIGRSFVKEWNIEELSRATRRGLKNRDFDRGRRMFASAGCFACHRFNNEGGMTGPDLTSSGGRYSPHDLLDQIINPSRVINEQYVPTELTLEGDKTVTGVIVNLFGDEVMVNTDMFDPNQQVKIDRNKVLRIEPSKTSPMPTGLLTMLKEDEILDLVAYILSGGDRKNGMFKLR